MNNTPSDFVPGEKVGNDFRAEVLAATSKWYNPFVHFNLEFGLYLAFMMIPLFFLHDWRWYHALMVPPAFIVGNIFEWWLHKDFMHVRRKPYFIYDAHTKLHHRLYWHHNMEMQSWRELPFVNFGPVTFIGVLVSAAFFAAIAWLIVGRNAALFFLAAEAAYMMTYEALHLSFHRPADSPVWKLPFIRWLGARHTLHHDPRNMRWSHFNVTFPLADWIFGTFTLRRHPDEPKPDP